MDLRDQRTPRASVRRCVHHEHDATTTRTNLHSYDVAGHYDVQIGIGIQVTVGIHISYFSLGERRTTRVCCASVVLFWRGAGRRM